MPLATCPSCRNSLDVPIDLFGGPVRCSNCLEVFTPRTTAGRSLPVAIPHSDLEVDFEHRKPDAAPSRRWLWVFLLGCTLLTMTCFGSCAGLIGVMSKPVMKPYQSPDGRFSASFPGDPVPIVQTRNDGRDVIGIEVVRDLPSEERYFIESITLTDAERKQEGQQSAADALAKWVKDQDGTILETDTIDHKGLPASQIVGQISFFKGNVVARAVRDDDHVYIVGVSGGVAPWNDRVIQFLDDFTPRGAPEKDKKTNPPAKGQRKKNPFKGDE